MNYAFTHDFRADLDLLDFESNDPWALIRFADGERSIIQGNRVEGADGWRSDSVDRGFHAALSGSLFLPDPPADFGFHLGISCPCCSESDAGFYRRHGAIACIGSNRVTFSNVFTNSNHDRFLEKIRDLKPIIVGSFPSASVRVAANLVNDPDWEAKIDRIVYKLCDPDLRGPIFVAAGPAANIIIHRYWQTAKNRQVIVDIGSALDPYLHGRATRGYHDPNHPNRKKVCTWQ